MRIQKKETAEEQRAYEEREWKTYFMEKRIWEKLSRECKQKDMPFSKILPELGLNASAIYFHIRLLDEGPAYMTDRELATMLDRKYADDADPADFPSVPSRSAYSDFYTIIAICEKIELDVNELFDYALGKGRQELVDENMSDQIQEDYVKNLLLTSRGSIKSIILQLLPFLSSKEQDAVALHMETRL